MEAIEFVHKYESYLDEIEKVIKPELQPVLDNLRHTDPHDLLFFLIGNIRSGH
jgi:hypothetical protein